MKNLIIVESPAKVKTIKKILGEAYVVEASVGHVRDLPTKTLGIDEAGDFQPEYQVIPGKEKVVSKLRDAAGKAEKVFLAPDPDREGEAIAWHTAELIKDKNQCLSRIQFNEITAQAVKEALNHPRPLNRNLFDSQQARRILDRLVGYKLSPLLWKKVKSGISAGRVQSVALRLIVDREGERLSFRPEEYWLFKANLKADAPPPFSAEIEKIKGKKAVISSAADAEALENSLKGVGFKVDAVNEKERKKSPPPPFITSTLQQEAHRKLGFTAKRTMSLAQSLYEGVDLGEMGTLALITYMRTDSVRIAQEAANQAEELIKSRFGDEYYPAKRRVYKTRAQAQDAHEAIRPIDSHLSPDKVSALLPRDQFRLYKLIWDRFIASQTADAKFWDTAVKIKAGDTLWSAKGERLIFPGWLQVYGKEEEDADRTLPRLEKGQELTLTSLDKEQKFTQPPPRYTEGTLIKELEEKGIGRPSTYATIISTLLEREYVTTEEKRFAPTELGTTVAELLKEHFTRLMDVGFTARMEESLDKVAGGAENWVELMREFTGEFYPTLTKAQKDMAKVKAGKDSGLACELCGKPMLIKFGKRGEFLACSGYPDCGNTKNFARDETGGINIREKAPQPEPEVVGKCPKCEKDLVVKRTRAGGRFIACSGYPGCKHAEGFSTGVPCPTDECTGTLVEKTSKRGQLFYSCDRYPDCKTIVSSEPVNETCPDCGFKVLVKKVSKTKGEYLACGKKGCKYKRYPDNES